MFPTAPTQFCPVPASRICITSCGVSGSIFWSTRVTFCSCCIRSVWVCNRPAVSISKNINFTCQCRGKRVVCYRSRHRHQAPGQLPAYPYVFPIPAIVSTAAARKVSAAASITDIPCRLKWLAIFAVVVVLPTPLTPTIKTTNGLCVICQSFCAICSKLDISCRKPASTPEGILYFFRFDPARVNGRPD